MVGIIVENVRGQWIVDEKTARIFQEDGIGYGDGALIELLVVSSKSLCCHPDNPIICAHQKKEG